MAEFILVAIIVIAMSVVGQIKRAQRRGQTQFKWPTPKSWQLPGPGQAPGQQPRQMIQPAPGSPPPMPQVIRPMPGTRPYVPQVGQPMQGYMPPPPQPRPSHRPPQHQLPAPQGKLDDRVRDLMAGNMEVAAVRLLCDEAEMGIIEAQAYARSLVAPEQQSTATTETTETTATTAATAPEPSADPEERYSGSAAFGTSTFERDDDNVWASGWVDEPEPDDRSDLDELWSTVRTAGRPPERPPAQQQQQS